MNFLNLSVHRSKQISGRLQRPKDEEEGDIYKAIKISSSGREEDIELLLVQTDLEIFHIYTDQEDARNLIVHLWCVFSSSACVTQVWMETNHLTLLSFHKRLRLRSHCRS